MKEVKSPDLLEIGRVSNIAPIAMTMAKPYTSSMGDNLVILGLGTGFTGMRISVTLGTRKILSPGLRAGCFWTVLLLLNLIEAILDLNLV